MTFAPYVIYSSRLPVLKPAHFIKAADKMYQAYVVRKNRQTLALNAAAVLATAPVVLSEDTLPAFAAMHGKLDVGRIVHLQYMALTTGIDTTFLWGIDPLWSKWVALAIDSALAQVAAPMEVDRWTYDKEMRLAYYKDVGAQTLYLEVVEYEVKATALTPSRYLKILPNGQATFIEAGAEELSLPKLGVTKRNVAR